MPSIVHVIRKIAGWPESTRSGEAAAVEDPQRGVAAVRPHANPWETAGAKLRDQHTSTVRTSNGTPVKRVASAALWTPQDETSGAVFARRFGRGLLWTVLLLAAVTGLREWFVPTKAPAPPSSPVTVASYPDEEAQAVAARFARGYLGWDEGNPQEREQLLAPVLSPGSNLLVGWDGHGRQEVLDVQPGTVTPGKNGEARVQVEVLIRPEAKTGVKDKQATHEAARWVGLDVPVVETSGRVVVTGAPGLVGIPVHGPKAPDLPAASIDAELSAQTQSVIEKFFVAYTSGDTGSVTAPGAAIPALPAGIAYKDLSSWSADTGSGSDRTGTAVVSWTLGGATVEQVYRITLTRVSSAEAARWQVADVHGGSL